MDCDEYSERAGSRRRVVLDEDDRHARQTSSTRADRVAVSVDGTWDGTWKVRSAMRIEPEISGVDVVLLGNFNPAIFTPAWFALYDLLPETAAENAQLQIAHPNWTAFSTEWLRLQVTPDRFVIGTRRDPHVRLRDLTVRVFKEHLCNTLIRNFSIDRYVHFRAASPVERDRIFRRLAPTEPWGRRKDDSGSGNNYIEMTSLIMTHRPPDRSHDGQVDVVVQPSLEIDDGRSIYVMVADRHTSGGGDAGKRAQAIIFLEDRFDRSIQRSNEIIDHVMSL